MKIDVQIRTKLEIYKKMQLFVDGTFCFWPGGQSIEMVQAALLSAAALVEREQDRTDHGNKPVPEESSCFCKSKQYESNNES